MLHARVLPARPPEGWRCWLKGRLARDTSNNDGDKRRGALS